MYDGDYYHKDTPRILVNVKKIENGRVFIEAIPDSSVEEGNELRGMIDVEYFDEHYIKSA